jgi:hypothetical protein
MSQADFEVKTIDGHLYKVYKMDPFEATDLLADIGQILAPSLGALGGFLAKETGDALSKVFEGFEADEDTNIDHAIERAVVGFFKQFDKAKQREFIAALSKVTVVQVAEGKEPNLKDVFSSHFRGRIKSLYQWLGFALKVQFSDFFQGAGLDIGQLVRRAVKK